MVGLGNGKRKSKAFEDFVLSKRTYLKEELGLCEYAIQTLLIYSNNFLHKRLKTQDVSDVLQGVCLLQCFKRFCKGRMPAPLPRIVRAVNCNGKSAV